MNRIFPVFVLAALIGITRLAGAARACPNCDAQVAPRIVACSDDASVMEPVTVTSIVRTKKDLDVCFEGLNPVTKVAVYIDERRIAVPNLRSLKSAAVCRVCGMPVARYKCKVSLEGKVSSGRHELTLRFVDNDGVAGPPSNPVTVAFEPDTQDTCKKKPECRKDEDCVCVFDSPAFFPRTGFDSQGHGAAFDGLVIHEGMELRWDSMGNYVLRFTAERPTVPVTLRLQFLVRVDDTWYTVTIAPIKIEPSEGDKENVVEIVEPPSSKRTDSGVKSLAVQSGFSFKASATDTRLAFCCPVFSKKWCLSCNSGWDLSIPLWTIQDKTKRSDERRTSSVLAKAHRCCSCGKLRIRRTGTARFGYGTAAFK